MLALSLLLHRALVCNVNKTSGLSLHSACMGSDNKSAEKRAKCMQTKHTELKSAAKRTAEFSIMQNFKFLSGKTQVCWIGR